MLTETFILGGGVGGITWSQILKTVQTNLGYSLLCPLAWFVKIEDILTSDKLIKVEITLKDDKQIKDKPCSRVFALSSMESEWTRKETVTLFMFHGLKPCRLVFIHRIFQARILKWVAISASRRSSWPRDQTCISLYLLHWQTDSLPLHHLGSPVIPFIKWKKSSTKEF